MVQSGISRFLLPILLINIVPFPYFNSNNRKRDHYTSILCKLKSIWLSSLDRKFRRQRILHDPNQELRVRNSSRNVPLETMAL